MKAHQGHTKDFEELTYAEQAQSINAQMLNLGTQIEVHLRKAETDGHDIESAKVKFAEHAKKLAARISEY